MQLTQFGEHTWVIQGGANIGVIAYGDRCLIIDSGMDKDVGRDILNQVKKLGLAPSALLSLTPMLTTSEERSILCNRQD